MADQISNETRYEVVRKHVTGDDSKQIAAELDVSETSVRNILKEFKEGRYPEYTQFIPNADASHRLMRELKMKGISVANAIVGAIVFTQLLELDIDPTRLQAIMTHLRDFIGNTPPTEFGRAVQQVVMLQQERGLTLKDLELLIVNKKAELDDILVKIKTATDQRNAAEAEKKKTDEDLDATLKQSDVTKGLLNQFGLFRSSWRDAGFTIGSIGADMQAVSNMVQASKSQGSLEAFKELQQLETETGMNYKTIVQKYKENCGLNEKARKKNDELLAERNQLSGRIADLKLEEAQQLRQNGLTKEGIERDLKLADRLKKAGYVID